MLTALYVPGDRPDRFDKALASGADRVIFDLEDAVAPSVKAAAREEVEAALARTGDPGRLSVRVNALDTPWGAADLAMIADVVGSRGVRLESVRLPKVDSADDVIAGQRAMSGLDIPIAAVVETARGVENLADIAAAPGVVAMSLGEADLRSDLRMSDEGDLTWCRSRLVVAARASGLPSPMMSVYTRLADDAGLVESCRWARHNGFLGRAAIHPNQIPLIMAGFAPSADEVETARELLDALASGERLGSGVTVLRGGRMIDAAMAESARTVLAVHARTGR